MSRFDRFLLSEEWLMVWPDSKQWGLNRSLSDHCLIILKNEKINWGPKPFKCFNAWLNQKSFRELVLETWETNEIKGWKGYQLKEKLKIVKAKAKEWSKNAMSHIDEQIHESKEAIAKLDLKAEMRTPTEQETMERNGKMQELWEKVKVKERMLQQKQCYQYRFVPAIPAGTKQYIQL